jgi:hypothetical protein
MILAKCHHQFSLYLEPTNSFLIEQQLAQTAQKEKQQVEKK